MLLIAVSCRGISRLLHHRVIIRSKLIQTVEIRALFAAVLVRVHRTPSLARINFTFEIFRLWSLNSFPKCMFKLYISNFTSRFFLISKLCIQLFSDIYVYKSSNRTNNFSLSLSLSKFTYRERIVLDRPIIITFTNPFGMLFRHPDAASPKSISRNKRAGRSLHAIQLVEIISIPTRLIERISQTR